MNLLVLIFFKIAAKKYYDWVVFNTHWTLMRPHVVIYLDVPVPIVQERIKARNLSWEVNGKALTPSFLHNMEKHYKQHLKEMK
jgi:NADH dehydrogenase (ubiquinone) 1 alpha subcomplex subunit 10